MKQPIVCPACNATNKPKAVTCRVCGERLVARRETSGAKEPVVLQRVMSGEVFSAVVVPGQEGVRIERKPRSALDEQPAPPPAEERPPGLTEREVMRLLREILAHSQRGEFPEAIRLVDRILRERPQDSKALVVKADALFRAGSRKEAAEIFDILVGIDPKNDKLWLDRARIQKAMQDLPEALKSYDTAISLDGSVPEAWYERAGVLDALANMSEAMRSLAKAIELRPEYPQARAMKVELEGRRAKEAMKAVAAEIEREIEDIESRAVAKAASGAGDNSARELDESAEGAVPVSAEQGASPAPAASAPAERESVQMPRPKGRLYTYVEGLDEALNGGIPEGHVVILAGPPGTLKSSLCVSIAVANATRERRPALYITFEEATESLLHQARSMGLPLEGATDSLTFLDARTLRASVPRAGEDWVDAFAAVLEALRTERPFDLLVLDALEGLEAVARFPDRRRAIFRLFEHLRALHVTTLVVAERPDIVVHGNVIYGRWAEDFLADGIIHLRHHLVSDIEVQRRVRVVKMRGTRHETRYMALLMDEGRLRATAAMAP